MIGTICTLPLDSLKIDPHRRLSRPSSMENRGESLDRRFPGMPLIIVDSKQRVIWGECRLEFLKQRKVVTAEIMQVALSPLESLYLGFNLLQAVFSVNLYEKLYFASLALEEAKPEEIRRRTGLDIPLNPGLIAQLPTLLGRDFAILLREGRIALPAARELAALAVDSRRSLLGLMETVHFTASQGLRLAAMVREILARDGCEVDDVLRRAEVHTALLHQRPAEAVLNRLHALRFPMVTAAEKEWRERVERLELPKEISVRHAPFFEPPGIQVNLDLPDLEALRRLVDGLKNE
ncbi:MAG TPA: hypothetical protein ENN40_03530 [Candidatus Aminicenantes bacterium]|nr:hypothetical protein [Candidatus Aminicenantes bacterium]